MRAREIVDDLDKLLAVLPPRIRQALEQQKDLSELLEVVLDLGRKPEGRFSDKFVYLSDEPVTREDIDYVVERVGEFNRDNRAGIEGTLHRISCIRNRSGRIVGLTCRVGRAVFGTVDIIRDIVETGKNILLLGKPGVGKCVAPDTWVATAEGLMPIETLMPDSAPAGSFFPIQTAVASLRGWAQATDGYFDGIRPTVRITTRHGFQLEGTANHCILVMSKNGRLTWRPLGELREGDFVAIARGHQCFGTETELLDPHHRDGTFDQGNSKFSPTSIPKEVPHYILQAPRHLVAEFLKTFLRSNGRVVEGRIEVSSESEKLLRQVQLLLLGLGTVASLRSKRVKGKVHWLLYLSPRDPDCDIVPFARIWLRRLIPLVSKSESVYAHLACLVNGDCPPNYAALNAVLERTEHLRYHPAWRYLRQLCDLNFFFDQIVEREEGLSPVYDFVVAETHAFFTNGFISHNTTKLREIARILADEFGKRVIVVDTSNEIAGDGDVPHPGIGLARRMQVPSPEKQADVMIEAVENHMPEVIVVDEIGRKEEADAARTIAERGVQLIATAHGNTLENLVSNPLLRDLVGGIQAVTLSDEEAHRRGTQKTVLERKAPPTFDVVIELIDRQRVAIHHDAAKAVDALLRGQPIQPEIREEMPDGSIKVMQPAMGDIDDAVKAKTFAFSREKGGRVYAYGVSRKNLERAAVLLGIPLRLVSSPSDADFIITLESHLRKGRGNLRAIAEQGQKPVFAIRSNTYAQLERVLRLVFGISRTPEEELAISEAEAAARIVLEENRPVELAPVGPHLRKLQHQVAQRYHLPSESIGREPRRRVVIYPNTDRNWKL